MSFIVPQRFNLSVLAACFLGFFMLMPVPAMEARADAEPAAIVRKALDAAKERKTMAALLPFVHWDSAFKHAGKVGVVPEGVSSAQQMEQYYSRLLDDPKELFLEMHASAPASVPEERLSAYRTHIEQAANELAKRINSANNKLADIDYTVSDSRIDGDRAEVDITASLKGETTIRTWSLVRVGGRWYFPNINVAAGW